MMSVNTNNNVGKVDAHIQKLQNVNSKLTGRMKDLNNMLDYTLNKANTKKQAKANKEQHVIKNDTRHKVAVKEGELKNTRVMIKKLSQDVQRYNT